MVGCRRFKFWCLWTLFSLYIYMYFVIMISFHVLFIAFQSSSLDNLETWVRLPTVPEQLFVVSNLLSKWIKCLLLSHLPIDIQRKMTYHLTTVHFVLWKKRDTSRNKHITFSYICSDYFSKLITFLFSFEKPRIYGSVYYKSCQPYCLTIYVYMIYSHNVPLHKRNCNFGANLQLFVCQMTMLFSKSCISHKARN